MSYIYTTTGTNIHTHYVHTMYTRTRTHSRRPLYTVLVPGARATYPRGLEYKDRLVGVLCSNRCVYLCLIQVSCSSTPRFFVFMEALGAPSPATLSRPTPAKPRRKSAAPTHRSRGDLAPVARSPGAHGSWQLLRCPRKSTKRCGCVHSFLLGINIKDVDQ